ncbi:hypothetical protein COT82_02510 [Candidatus Campbellbacteria bacterium CG10_big_fil_rev_8_21_14_0_10_35_52]|uniref:DUF1573 domain-containing protein n=1 Tax=Candidatus Campbellbacteria bacterium CG10_big_fil_rev_8_21_14_0_10_35_52 TaxID=1974527 RepID=A0A2M6WUW0_9BACT|nr:MAG: hypothetical protein COT82_02510 [Candidatus Campbellbacteria bacterium CG10_big_fil_rev_8_21_14_0_10_35_52]
MTNKISNGMNKYIVGIIGILAIIFLVFAVDAQNNKKQEENKQVASVITVEKTMYNFGDIDIFDGKVSATYTLKNEGDEDVKIISAVTSCACTEGEIGNMRFGMHSATGEQVIIPAGGEEILTATFDPLAHGPNGTGKATRQLMLKTNSTETPEIEVRFEANVIKNKNE